jgi:predicted ATPase
MRALPEGTVTLLFTDIEGSTRLLERLGDAYAETLAQHRRTLRSVFERHGGVEVGTDGDAFFVAFAAASDALSAAEEAQAELARAGSVRVRIGMHTGEPTVYDGDYVGMDVHRAARVGAAGHGGQILLTDATRSLVGEADLTDLGVHELKDVGELRLYQVGAASFPPLKTIPRADLPVPASSLIGRERERSELRQLVTAGAAPVVTVVGPGGTGKTRLAIEVARDVVGSFVDGAWFIDLSSIVDADRFEPTIASAFGAPVDLRETLRDRHVLLVLDNFEQIVGAADALARLLEACPRIVALVTSREILHLRGEREYRLSPLVEDDSIELFRERALAVASGFDAPRTILAQICERLEGIPLAIELAAARVRVLDPEQLLHRLDRRLPILTGGDRDAPERHRTLRATIGWSHELLDERERSLFARLAVFVHGWTLEAAEEVCEADLDTLEALATKSLISSQGGRFRMLESIHEYASEHLGASGELDELRRRHAGHYAALAERARPHLTGPDHRAWLDRLADDYENLRTALGWLTARGSADIAIRLAAGMVFFWLVRGRYEDGLDWLDRALAMDGNGRSIDRARAMWGAGFIRAIGGDQTRAEALLHGSLELARALGDGSMVARALDILGLLAFFENDLVRARASFEESIGYARAADDRWCLADVLGTLGSIYPLQGEFALAKQAGAEGLAIARRERDLQGMRMALFGLALTDVRLGELSSARALAEEGLGICRQIGDRFFCSYFLWILASVAVEEGDPPSALAHARESLEIAEELDAPLLVVCALEASAAAARMDGDDEHALELLTRADELGRGGMVPLSYVATVARALGELAVARGDRATAREHLDRSLSVARRVGDTWGVARSASALDDWPAT